MDSNRAQNHLVELKAAALARLEHRLALGFLGASTADAAERDDAYRELRATLSEAARGYWDRNRRALERGVLGARGDERSSGPCWRSLRWSIHPRARMQKLLACTTLEEQNRFYDEEWDTWRWRLLFALMLNRGVFTRTYSPDFFRHVENPSFSRHFRGLVERTLRELPVGDNYFLHFLIEGRYRAELPGGLPVYLEAASGPAWSEAAGRLVLADATFTEYLRMLPTVAWTDSRSPTSASGSTQRSSRDCLPRSCARRGPGPCCAFATSSAGPTSRERFADAFPLEPGEDAWIAPRPQPDAAPLRALLRPQGRGMTGGTPTPPHDTAHDRFSAARWRARPALPGDNAALVALAAACPMEGDIGLCVDRSPDFFALNRLEGEAWRVDVVDAADGALAGCIALARRRVYLLGVEREVMYVGDLKVHPEHRGSGAAEALIRHAWQACREMGGDDVPTLVTVLSGNAAIERRARGPRGSPPWTSFARLVAHSVSLVWKRRAHHRCGHARRAGLRGGSRRDGRALAEARTGSQLRACVRTGRLRGVDRAGPGAGARELLAAARRRRPYRRLPRAVGPGRPSSIPAWCAIRAHWPRFASRTTCSLR